MPLLGTYTLQVPCIALQCTTYCLMDTSVPNSILKAFSSIIISRQAKLNTSEVKDGEGKMETDT